MHHQRTVKIFSAALYGRNLTGTSPYSTKYLLYIFIGEEEKKIFRIFSICSLIIIALIGCSSPSASVLQKGDGTSNNVKAGGEEWQTKWDKTYQTAKKEGKVVIYGAATGQIREALIKSFYDKYGISVEYMAAKGPEIATRILAERKAGLYIPDVVIGAGTPSITVLKPAGAFDSIEPVLMLPDVLDSKGWMDNTFPWVDKDHYFVAFLAYASPKIVVNPNMVKPDEIKSYRDLLDQKWKGKMVMHDPTIDGAGHTFVAALADYIMGKDYLKQLAAQEPFISKDHRLLAEWVARGKYPVGLAIENEAIEQMKSAGAPIQYILAREGTYVTKGTGFLALPRNAPHPGASAIFINWILSKEGQLVYTDVAKLQSARQDIPTANVDPLSIRNPGVKYFSTSSEEFQLELPESIEMAKEVFGHLIK